MNKSPIQSILIVLTIVFLAFSGYKAFHGDLALAGYLMFCAFATHIILRSYTP